MFDLLLAALILLFVLPLMLVCMVVIRLGSPGPVIFRQSRLGLGGREFTCFKLRTMVVDAEEQMESLLSERGNRQQWARLFKLPGDPRVTALGRLMRRYSLDELPQLFNVFRGDMSVVGPRPIVSEEIRRYGEKFADYCSVNPGLTGLWQVSGHHRLSYDERVNLDAKYARAKSFRLDLLILLKTVPVVILGQNE